MTAESVITIGGEDACTLIELKGKDVKATKI